MEITQFGFRAAIWGVAVMVQIAICGCRCPFGVYSNSNYNSACLMAYDHVMEIRHSANSTNTNTGTKNLVGRWQCVCRMATAFRGSPNIITSEQTYQYDFLVDGTFQKMLK